MKKEGHPEYQEVLFVDTATGHKFVCGSTLKPTETEMYEGKEYPVFRVPVSSASHPFFTGSQQFVDSEGRVDKFRKRYAKQGALKEEKPALKKKVEPSKEKKEGSPKKKAAAKQAPKKTAKKAAKKTTSKSTTKKA